MFVSGRAWPSEMLRSEWLLSECLSLSGFSLTQLQKKWPHYPIKMAIALSSPAPLLHLCAA